MKHVERFTITLAIAVGLLLWGFSLGVVGATDLTPEQRLKAQVQQLTEQNLQLQASLAQCQLTSQQGQIQAARQILSQEFRVSLKCEADDELEGWPPTGCKKKPSASGGSKQP